MFEFSIENIVVTLGYLGIFLLMISNGVLSFPSSQILYIVTGFFIFKGDLTLALVVLVGAVGNTIGNIILYELSRRKGLKYITKFQMFPEHAIRKVQVAFNKRGTWFLFIGKLVPALKVFVPIPAGIAKMNRVLYTTIIAITSAIWTLPFIAIGFYFGKSSDVFGKYAIVLAFIALIVIGVFYKYMNSEEIVREVEGVENEDDNLKN